MQRRFIQLVVRARRLVTPAPTSPASSAKHTRLTGRREVGTELTQFSFRLAFMIDLAYVGVGALGGAAIGRASALPPQAAERRVACPNSSSPPLIRDLHEEPVTPPLEIRQPR